MPQNSSERPFSAICVHYCVTTAARESPALRQCTQMAQNGSERTFSAICVHYCITTGRPRDPIASPCVTTGCPRDPRAATVYTNGLERLRRDVFGDLCTLLCPHGPSARPPRRNSVHKCPETAPKGRFRRSVYTIVSPRGARVIPAPQQCTQMAQNGAEGTFSAICVHYCVTTGHPRDPRAAIVYTNGPERLREAVFGDLCTLLCHHRPPA